MDLKSDTVNADFHFCPMILTLILVIFHLSNGGTFIFPI